MRFLLFLAIGLAVAATLVIAGIFASRELFQGLKRRKFKRLCEKCREAIMLVDQPTTEELVSLARQLKELYPKEVLETVLEGLLASQEIDPKQIAALYDHFGFVDACIRQLQEATRWAERAQAAEKLGRLAPAKATLPLIAVIEDPKEDPEVKNMAISALGRISDPKAIKPLIEALAGANPQVTVITRSLIRFGSSAVEPLLHAFQKSPHVNQRRWIVFVLGQLRSTESVKLLISALVDHNPSIREEAARSLGNIKARDALHSLVDVLTQDPVPATREAAAWALGQIADPRALEGLKQVLKDQDFTTRVRTLETIEKMGEAALPIFLEALGDGDRTVSQVAALGLDRVGYVARMIEDLKSADPEKLNNALKVLGRVAQAGIVQSLIHATNHEDFRIRYRLIDLLGKSHSQAVYDALAQLIRDSKEWVVRAQAYRALAQLGDRRAIPLWIRGLQEEAEDAQEILLESLAHTTKTLLRDLKDVLVEKLNSENLAIRLKALTALGNFKEEWVEAILLNTLRDASSEVRVQAGHLLGQFASETAADGLIEALRDSSIEVMWAAVASLGEIKNPKCMPALVRVFERVDPDDAIKVAQVLARMKFQDFHNVLDSLMGLTNPSARAGVALVLGLIGEGSALPFLISSLADRDPNVRSAACQAIGALALKEAVGHLLPCLRDSAASVRRAVLRALIAIGEKVAVSELKPVLEDPDFDVCLLATMALGILGGDQAEELLKDKAVSRDSPLKLNVAISIGRAFLGVDEARENILQSMTRKDWASAFYGFINEMPASCTQRLWQFLNISESFLRKDGVLDSKAMIKQISEALQSNISTGERLSALSVLEAFAREKGDAAAILREVFAEDPAASLRAKALELLARASDPDERIPQIRHGLQDPSLEVKKAALNLIGALPMSHQKTLASELLNFMSAARGELREIFIKTLGGLYKQHWKELADLLMGSSREEDWIVCLHILGSTGDAQALSLMELAFRHQDPEVRSAGLQALKRFPQGLISSTQIVPKISFLLNDPSREVRLALADYIRPFANGETRELLTRLAQDPDPKIREAASLS